MPVSVLMLQARLAERLAADPDEARYGGVTVRARRCSSTKLLEPVRPEQFEPPPAVESALIRLRRVDARFPLPPAPDRDEADRRAPDGGAAADAPGDGSPGSAGRDEADDPGPGSADEAFWRDLLDTLFLHREATLRSALDAAGAPTNALIRALDRGARRRLPERVVASISPNDFGRIAWAAAAAGWRPAPVSDRAKRTAQR